jgi:hypothetical protein
MAESLLSCPFCGGVARLSGPGYRGAADCYPVAVACDDCEARGPEHVADQSEPESEAFCIGEAVAAWNRRTLSNTA